MGYRKTERSGGLAVHDHLELGRELHWEIAGLLAFEDTAGVVAIRRQAAAGLDGFVQIGKLWMRDVTAAASGIGLQIDIAQAGNSREIEAAFGGWHGARSGKLPPGPPFRPPLGMLEESGPLALPRRAEHRVGLSRLSATRAVRTVPSPRDKPVGLAAAPVARQTGGDRPMSACRYQ